MIFANKKAKNKDESSSNKSTNRFNLNLSADDIDSSNQSSQFTGGAIHPLTSPGYDEVPIWNILPSYQLYESTFSKNITPTQEDLRHNPPNYENSSPPPNPASTADGVSFDYFTGNITSSVPLPPNDMPNHWENSILGNTQKMKTLADITPKSSSNLRVEIHVTDGDPRNSVSSKSIDIGSYEYQQGDNINGYVLIENESDVPINFDMFSVVFEGKIIVKGDTSDSKRPMVFYKFLNMFDYYASWTPANMSDKPVTSEDVDPIDGSRLRLPDEKFFSPHVLYKRFFNFKLPERLLDCACETHSLVRHCEILPSIGLARDQFMQEIRKLRQRNVTTRQKGQSDFTFGPSKPAGPSNKKKPTSTFGERVKDLSFPDTAISYSVVARVIGRASQFGQKPKDGPDEFIIMEDSSCFVRVIPKERLTYEIELEALDAESRLIYRNLVDRINDKIRLGNEVLSDCSQTDNMANTLSRTLSISKQKQLYTTGNSKPASTLQVGRVGESFLMATPLKKKQTIASIPKVVGLLELASPKIDHRVKYVPAFKYHQRQGGSTLGTKLNVPIELLFTPSGDTTKPPEIKSISTEIIVFTYRSKKYPVPIEITPDLIFKNVLGPHDDYEHHVGEKFKNYLAEITSLAKQLNHEVLGIESQLIMDIKALADLSCKYHHFKVDDVHVKNEKTLGHWNYTKKDLQGQFNKTIDLSMDLKPLLSKEMANSNEDFQKGFLTLVPNFQNCITGRFYFLHVIVKFHNHETASLKIPFMIQS